jgi:peptidyl-tRNA hydrolase, PTH1 family
MLDKMFDSFKEEKKFKAYISKKNDILGIKPQTFMNLSGESVASIVHFYKLDPTRDILILSDDIDMEFGKVRFRTSGNHGGQNGLRDIIEKLGTNEFARLKIGIGRDPLYSVSDWVLSKFQDTEIQVLEKEVFPKVETLIHDWLTKN